MCDFGIDFIEYIIDTIFAIYQYQLWFVWHFV